MSTRSIIIGSIALLVLFALAWFSLRGPSSIHLSPQGGPTSTFSDEAIGFSFAYPATFHAQKMLDDTGETVLAQSQDATQGVQVFIRTFSDPGTSITPERVTNEAGLQIANASPIKVAGKADGLVFDNTGSNPPLREAWFAYNGYLYQVQVWASQQQLLTDTLNSWTFTQ